MSDQEWQTYLKSQFKPEKGMGWYIDLFECKSIADIKPILIKSIDEMEKQVWLYAGKEHYAIIDWIRKKPQFLYYCKEYYIEQDLLSGKVLTYEKNLPQIDLSKLSKEEYEANLKREIELLKKLLDPKAS